AGARVGWSHLSPAQNGLSFLTACQGFHLCTVADAHPSSAERDSSVQHRNSGSLHTTCLCSF
ncbi:hypothetical protein Nmel_006428, partial [Mimus melanotis]